MESSLLNIIWPILPSPVCCIQKWPKHCETTPHLIILQDYQPAAADFAEGILTTCICVCKYTVFSFSKSYVFMAKGHQRKYPWPTYFCQCIKGGSSWLFWDNLDVKLGEWGPASSRTLTDRSARNGLAHLFSKSTSVHFFQHLSVS